MNIEQLAERIQVLEAQSASFEEFAGAIQNFSTVSRKHGSMAIDRVVELDSVLLKALGESDAQMAITKALVITV